jgi:hypothetical protein
MIPPGESVREKAEDRGQSIKSDCHSCAVLFASLRLLAQEVDLGNRRLAGELRQTVKALDACNYCATPDALMDPLLEFQRRRDALEAV